MRLEKKKWGQGGGVRCSGDCPGKVGIPGDGWSMAFALKEVGDIQVWELVAVNMGGVLVPYGSW